MRSMAVWLLTLCSCLCPAAFADTQTGQDGVQSPASTPATTAASQAPVTTGKLPEPAYAKVLRRDVSIVFAGDDFHQRKESTGLVARPWLKKWLESLRFEKNRGPHPKLPDFSGLAKILEYLLMVTLGLALLWLLWKGWRWLAPQINQRPEKSGPLKIAEARTRKLTADELPDAISLMARHAWEKGDAGGALSLLYRGALRSLEKNHHLSLPASATEGECLHLARRSGKAAVTEAFAPIVQAWMALAYAGRLPDDFEKLAALYASHFDRVPIERPAAASQSARTGGSAA